MHRGVKYYSFLEASGYGLAAIAYIEALLEQGIQVYWTPFLYAESGYQPWTWSKNAKQLAKTRIAECVRDPLRVEALMQCLTPIDTYQCIVMHTVPEYWPTLIEPDGYHIGYTVWETSRLPDHFSGLINQLDCVMVPSKFNEPVFRRSGVTIPIKVVPHILAGLDQFGYSTVGELQFKAADGDSNFVFYTINTWTARKALWTLLHCYLKAFSGNDQVELRLKTSQYGPADEQDKQYHETEDLLQNIVAQYQNPASIMLINEHVESHQIAALHQNGDCYVSTTHSEGWGLGAFEAAACGNPVIMTGWGGQLDFLSADCASLIRYRMVNVVDARSDSYNDVQKWAQIDEAHMIEEMRAIYTRPEKARKRAVTLARQIRQDYSSNVIGNKLIKAIFSQNEV